VLEKLSSGLLGFVLAKNSVPDPCLAASIRQAQYSLDPLPSQALYRPPLVVSSASRNMRFWLSPLLGRTPQRFARYQSVLVLFVPI